MSKIVTTELGRFRHVIDGDTKRFLFECPHCKEWLPMDEDRLAGTGSMMHFMGDRFYHPICPYDKKLHYGAALVSTMQARVLMGEEGVKPWDTDYKSLILGE